MDAATRKARAAERVDSRGPDLERLSLEIHARPELAFEERFAASALADFVEREGAKVTRGAGGLETAFVAQAGSGKPVVALCAEYDALPGVGHACGHNVMGTAAVGAFLAVLAFGFLSMLEGWAAFFQRRASPVVPLLFTLVMLAGWATAFEVAARRKKRSRESK